MFSLQNPSKANQSVEKVLQIIETLAGAGEPMRLIEIAGQVGMPSSTVLRMITSLVEHGYAYQDERTLRYGLTLRFAQVGNMVLERFDIRDIVHPFLGKLAQESGETACIAVEQDMQAVYLDVVENPNSVIKIRQAIGKTAPMHATASGKLMLMQYSKEKLKKYVETRGLPVYTSYTISTLPALEKALDSVRIQGFALDDQECEVGVRCIAMPLYNFQKKVIATICLSGPIYRMSYQYIEEMLKLLQVVTGEINNKLLYKV